MRHLRYVVTLRRNIGKENRKIQSSDLHLYR
jgi:hypothetical protein